MKDYSSVGLVELAKSFYSPKSIEFMRDVSASNVTTSNRAGKKQRKTVKELNIAADRAHKGNMAGVKSTAGFVGAGVAGAGAAAGLGAAGSTAAALRSLPGKTKGSGKAKLAGLAAGSVGLAGLAGLSGHSAVKQARIARGNNKSAYKHMERAEKYEIQAADAENRKILNAAEKARKAGS